MIIIAIFRRSQQQQSHSIIIIICDLYPVLRKPASGYGSFRSKVKYLIEIDDSPVSSLISRLFCPSHPQAQVALVGGD